MQPAGRGLHQSLLRVFTDERAPAWLYLYQTDAADTNANGCQDWVEFSFSATNDTDGDTIMDRTEVVSHGTSPYHADSDFDGMPDNWEIDEGFDPLDPADASGDADGDQLTNVREYENGADPHDPDTDDDNLPDGCEVDLTFTDPADNDSDDDTLLDWWECRFGMDPNTADSTTADPDGDGLDNATELR